jgi:hypothetical protein
MDVDSLTLSLMLYVLLPLWVVCGSLDYCCHRATRIEHNTGIRESMLHSLMGVLVGVPMWLSLFFEMNVLVLLTCVVFFVLHEIVAHIDVCLALPNREVSVWEQHVHAYLSTIPFYLMSLIICRNWAVFIDLLTMSWSGQMEYVWRQQAVGSMAYIWWYTTFMLVFAGIPYTEELVRCWRAARVRQADA